MAKRDLLVSLAQMRDHAFEAIAFADGKRREELDADRLLTLALIRLIEIVGEARAGWKSRIGRDTRRSLETNRRLAQPLDSWLRLCRS